MSTSDRGLRDALEQARVEVQRLERELRQSEADRARLRGLLAVMRSIGGPPGDDRLSPEGLMVLLTSAAGIAALVLYLVIRSW